MDSAHPGAQAGSSSDQFLKVEERGVEPVPESERHGRPRELAFIWAGAFLNYASLLTASLLTDFFGLGVWDGLAAVVLGTLAAALILGLLSHTGPRSGLPQIAFTRRIFGDNGARIGAFLTLFLAVGWFAVDTVIAALAGVQILTLTGLGGAGGPFPVEHGAQRERRRLPGRRPARFHGLLRARRLLVPVREPLLPLPAC